MRALQIGDVAYHLAIGIYNHDVGTTGDEDAMRRGVGVQIVPAALPAEYNLLNQVVACSLRRGERICNECGAARNKQNSRKRLAHYTPPSI